jgi:hypothetical protein
MANGLWRIIHNEINPDEGRHSCESRNPEKHWIPPYQVRGKLSQARNDKKEKTYTVVYSKQPIYAF